MSLAYSKEKIFKKEDIGGMHNHYIETFRKFIEEAEKLIEICYDEKIYNYAISNIKDKDEFEYHIFAQYIVSTIESIEMIMKENGYEINYFEGGAFENPNKFFNLIKKQPKCTCNYGSCNVPEGECPINRGELI